MLRSILLRGGSAGALTFVLVSTSALTQEALPTIDVGAQKPRVRREVVLASRVRREAAPAPAAETARPTENGPGSSESGAGLGGRFTGYTVNVETPAVTTKDNIPILQNPVAVQVVPREAMDDQQAISVKDAIVGNVSSVQRGSNFPYDSFNIRGFDNVNIFRNNLRLQAITNLETANLQSIEVLKGPAAMLFGRLEPGGVVNLVVKRPLDTPYFSVEEQAGSWGLTRTTVDATGPLTGDKTWLYRVNAAFLHSDSFRNFVTNQNAFIAPTITYHPTEQFRFNLDAEYQNTIFVQDQGIPAIGTRPAPIPISRYLGQPSVTVFNPSRQEREFIGYDWTFNIAKDWSLTNRFAYFNVDYVQRGTPLRSLNPLGNAGLTLIDGPQHRETISSNLDLKGKFETGPFNHSVLIGTDYYRFAFRAHSTFDISGSKVGPINIFFPTDRIYFKRADNNFSAQGEVWKGVYAQDMISFADDRLHLLVGGRYDWADFGSGSSGNSFAEATMKLHATGAFDKAFSPRLGAVVQPLPWLSFYGNFSQSFGVTNGIPTPGNPAFPPQKGVQYEGGAKAEFFDGRLVATFAYYDITKTNVVEAISGTPFSRPVGEVESKGVEFDLAGRINDYWSLIGNYSHDDVRITKDSVVANIGNKLQNVPRNAGNIWVKFDADGDFRGLSLGGGLNIVGERQGDNKNTFQLPAYTLVNAMVMYRFQPAALPWVKNLTAQLNVTNLLDTTYYTNSTYGGRFSILPGTPRTFIASIRAEF